MYDAESPVVSSETRPRARKDYICCECGGVIKKGKVYSRYAGCWDGEWTNYRTCDSCVNIRKAYYKKHPNEDVPGAFAFRELLSDLAEKIGKHPNWLLTLLYNGGSGKLSSMWASFYNDVLEQLYSGQAGYEVWGSLLWPHGHLNRIKQRGGVEVSGQELLGFDFDQTEMKLLCVADCGVFDVTAVIANKDILDLFLDPLDTRPKTFIRMHAGMVRHLFKTKVQ